MDVPLLARPESAVVIVLWEMGRVLRSCLEVPIQQMFLFGAWVASRGIIKITVLEMQKLSEKGVWITVWCAHVRGTCFQMRNQKSSSCGGQRCLQTMS